MPNASRLEWIGKYAAILSALVDAVPPRSVLRTLVRLDPLPLIAAPPDLRLPPPDASVLRSPLARSAARSVVRVEAFACGTAAVITPIAEIKSSEFGIWMPEVEDRVSMSLRQELTDIQYGRVPDRHNWLHRLDA